MSGCAQRDAGFTYVEVLVAVAVVLLTIVPALALLRTGLMSSEVHQSTQVDRFRLMARVEEVLAEPHSRLDEEALAVASETTPTLYSDNAGTEHRRLVYLARYDGDDADGDGNPFTGGDEGLVWIRVEVAGTELASESLSVW